MQLKQYDRYSMDFKSKWLTRSAGVMGVSLFVRVVYFFGLMNFAECGAFQVIFDMILTMGLSITFLILVAALRRNAPGLYGILGCAFLLLMMITTFPGGNVLRIILAVLGYTLAGAVLIGTFGGFIPGKMLGTLALLLPMAVRILAFDLGKLGIFAWVLEFSRLLVLVSMLCLVLSLKSIKPTK